MESDIKSLPACSLVLESPSVNSRTWAPRNRCRFPVTLAGPPSIPFVLYLHPRPPEDTSHGQVTHDLASAAIAVYTSHDKLPIQPDLKSVFKHYYIITLQLGWCDGLYFLVQSDTIKNNKKTYSPF